MSKEVPLFVYKDKQYDLCFYDDMINLYAVKNLLSGVMVSSLIPAANDFIAAKGFQLFLTKQKESGDNEVYQLIRLGILNTEEIKIIDSERQILLDSRDDVEDFINEATAFLIAKEDE